MESKAVEKLTIDEIARKAYVSRSVVSRVLNNRANVSDAARQRVLHVIEKYNYTPSVAARSLVTNRSYEIGVLAPRKRDDVLANGYWPLLFLGIAEACNRSGYLASLSMIEDGMGAVLQQRILAGHPFDAYLVVDRDVLGLAMPSIRQRQLPVLLVGFDPQHPDVSFVNVDNSGGAHRATAYLVDLGHRRIAAVAGPPGAQESADRLAGFTRALREVGLGDGCVVAGDYSERSGYEAVQHLMTLQPRPTALFCMSDAMATGALLALNDAGLSVPHDVSVVGYDGLPASAYTLPPLTTLRQPICDLGSLAARRLLDLVEGRCRGQVREKLAAELVVRRSCAPPPEPCA